ncbi:MAG: hypothetical protein H7A23_19725 [Leptospiraceae bacterium]|nr:hypothetical protein [Leptospiraceae bacterium]
MEKRRIIHCLLQSHFTKSIFATLNTEMDLERRFRVTNGIEVKDKDYMVHSLYRYEKNSKIPKAY